MTSPENVRRERSLTIISSLMRGPERDREYRHSRAQGNATTEYVGIRKDVIYQRKIKAELRALGYKYQWQRKPWRILRDCQYVPAFNPDRHAKDRPAEEPSATSTANDGHQPGATILGNLMAVARRSKPSPVGRP